MPRQNADDIELRCLLAGRVRRRGTAVLHLADTCRQGEPACNQSAPLPSVNVVDGGVGWCARTSTRKTHAEQQNSSPTEGASAGTAECRREWHFRDAASSRVRTSDVTSNWRTDIGTDRRTLRSWRSTAKQAETVFVTCDLIETVVGRRRSNTGDLVIEVTMELFCTDVVQRRHTATTQQRVDGALQLTRRRLLSVDLLKPCSLWQRRLVMRLTEQRVRNTDRLQTCAQTRSRTSF